MFDVVPGLAGATLVIGGDGRFLQSRGDPARESAWPPPTTVGRVIVGQGGILSTPAASNLIRRRGAIGGLILSASHNPGGPDEDFGIKYNVANGGPAPQGVTEAIFARTMTIDRYLTADTPTRSTSILWARSVIADMPVEVVDPVDRLCRADGNAVRLRRDPPRRAKAD